MKNMKEMNQGTATNPWSRGGPLPLHHDDGGGDVGDGGDPSGGGSSGVSISSLYWFWLYFGISLFLWRSPRGSLDKSFI
jgi:hypothetical protein